MRELNTAETLEVGAGIIGTTFAGAVAGGVFGLLYSFKDIPATSTMAYLGVPMQYAINGAVVGIIGAFALVALIPELDF